MDAAVGDVQRTVCRVWRHVRDYFSGNNVFLSLYNPNYAGVFLTIFAPVFAVMCSSEKRKEEDFLRDIVCRMSDPDLVYLLPLHIFCIACGISRRMYPF